MANRLTLIDLAKRTGNDASVGLVESMVQANGLLENMGFTTINGISYRVKTRIALPTVVTRGFNQGITESKSIIKSTNYETKIFNSRSIVDQTEADSYSEGAAVLRNEEDLSHISATGNKFNSVAYYGNASTDPTQFDGLSTVLNSTAISTVKAQTGASGSTTSIYFVSFNSAVTPQGVVKGVQGVQSNTLSALDKGAQLVNDADSKQYWAYITEIMWQAGLAVYDTRSVGRYLGLTSSLAPTIPNIDAILTNMLPFRAQLILVNKTGLGLMKALKTTITYVPTDTELKLSPDSYNGIPIVLDENITDTET